MAAWTIAGLQRARAVQWGPAMRSYNVEMDLVTGAAFAIGKDGRRHTMSELGAAEAAAERGDPEALALLESVDHSIDLDGRRLSPEEVRARFEQLVHDCPECQAARARGEAPRIWSAAEIETLGAEPWARWSAADLVEPVGEARYRRRRRRARRHR